MVRLPLETHEKYKTVQTKMINDIRRVTGKPNLNISLNKVFDVVVNPNYNENFIQVDLKKLSSVATRTRK